MANVCSFEMRVRGTKENCKKFIESDFHGIYELYYGEEQGNDKNYLAQFSGECRWSIIPCFIDSEYPLKEKSKEYNVEVEIFGYDLSELENIDHFHYKNGECLHSYCLPPYFTEYDEIELSEEDKEKYEYIPEHEMYSLKDEYMEEFSYNAETDEINLPWIMTFEP